MDPANVISEEKARILAWRYENIPIKEICHRTGQAKSSIMALLAAARYLPPPKRPLQDAKERLQNGRIIF